ncbi:hypothetical protein [Agromyces seonyuensis]|uniref:Uncharacterized protein n=1 Tax=Agromyces seonyuensis TaxID=2662446 RepID=A0A6I4P7V2_9MICO|nr:hypothetical protein [Agromyces seonyuensis]MWB99974.1 hypothetical protein [Agromyces seonyuensis]
MSAEPTGAAAPVDAPALTLLPGALGAPVCEGDACTFPGFEDAPVVPADRAV